MRLKRRPWTLLLLVLFGVAGLCLLLSNASQKNVQTAVVNSNPAAALSLQIQPATKVTQKDAFGTRLAEDRRAIITKVALTAAPTITFGPPLVNPTYTPVMGMLPGEPEKNADNPQILNAWREIINGETVEISAGREGKAVDPRQGVVIVNVWYKSIDEYSTPQRVGPVLMTSVNGSLCTLVSQDVQHSFVFDIGTRKWLSP